MSEPLKGKKRTLPEKPYDFDFFNFEDVKSAVEFYKRYRDDEALLMKERRDIFDKWYNSPFEMYENWLFDYCFGDVIE